MQKTTFSFDIQAVSRELSEEVLAQINQKTKPPGSLGQLEELALQIALIQNTAKRSLTVKNPHVLVFAGDHGIAENNISIAGSEVTAQMVANFLSGGAAINALSKANQCQVKVINSGVKHDIPASVVKEVEFINFSAGNGTADLSQSSAMTHEQLKQCFSAGVAVIENHVPEDCDVIALGEMGIGNTSSAAALLGVLLNAEAVEVVGRGTGISDTQFQMKTELVQNAIHRVSSEYQKKGDVKLVLQELGGFEIAQMCSAMLCAAKRRKIILVDGFIVTAAAMIAIAIEPNVKDFMVFSHCSQEQAHQKMLDTLKVKPLLNLGMRLGEGTGAVMAVPILRSAVAFYNEMATFDSLGIKV